MTAELDELQRWYLAQCDGDWEHEFGVRIETLDNPGWSLEVNLEGTALEGIPFAPVEDMAPERDWIRYVVLEGKFDAVGGPLMLRQMIRTFLDWARQAPASPSNGAA